MINTRTKFGIEKARADEVKFERKERSRNKDTADKLEKIAIYLDAKKNYDWIVGELGVSKQTISEIKKSFTSMAV